jgi:hypothetical protein
MDNPDAYLARFVRTAATYTIYYMIIYIVLIFIVTTLFEFVRLVLDLWVVVGYRVIKFIIVAQSFIFVMLLLLWLCGWA